MLSILSAPLYIGAVHLWYFSVVIFFLAASFTLYWICLQSSPDGNVIHTPLDAGIGIYLFFLVLASVQTQIPAKSAVELFKTFSVVVVFYATVYYCRERHNTRVLMTALVLLGGLLALTGLLQWLGALPKSWWHRAHFLSSVYVNHNHFAGFMEMILPLSIGLVLAEEQASKKILFTFLAGFMGVAFMLSLSRGGFLSMAMALGLLAILLMANKILKKTFWVFFALAFMMFCVIGLFGITPVLDRLQSMKGIHAADNDLSIAQRVLIWKGSVKMIAKHFWFGTGPGTFEYAFFMFRPKGFISRPGFAHNDYLQLWADCGVFVFFAATALFAILFRKGFKILEEHHSIFSRAVGAGCLSALLALAVHSLVDFNFHIPANWIYFSVISGILVSLDRPLGYVKGLSRTAMQVFISAICVLTILGCVFFGISDWWLWKGKRELKIGRYETAYRDFSNSIAVDRWNAEPYYLRVLAANGMPEKMKNDTFGLTDEKQKNDLRRAIRLNPYEPYFDYNLARIILRSTAPDRISEVLPYYQQMVLKDPKDPLLYFLSAKDILRANKPLKNRATEAEAVKMFGAAIALDPSLAYEVYRTLFGYGQTFESLEALNRRSPGGSKGFIQFLEKSDLWKYHRKYYLNNLGIDPDEKYRISSGTHWNDKPFVSYRLKEFLTQQTKSFMNEDFIFTNGRFETKVSFERSLCRLELRARGTRAGNSYPYLVVLLDGKVIDALYIDSPEFVNFFSILRTTPGEHTLSFEFINDYAGGVPHRDRNIWLDRLELKVSLDQ